MKKVLMICHGNICRSPMAEYVMQHMVQQRHIAHKYHIESAATSREEIGNDVHHGTKRKLREVGIACPRRAARQVTRQDYDDYDYLIVMDQMNIRNLNRIIGSDPEHKVYKLLEFAGSSRDIADPWYTGNFDETYDDVVEGVTALIDKIESEQK